MGTRSFASALLALVFVVGCGRIGFEAADASTSDSCGSGETCSGLDDDCDGVADEGFPCVLGEVVPCATGCSSMGTRECIAGCVFDVCVPPMELCNSLDDDCNGAVDDGFACVSGQLESCATACGSTGSQMCDTACAFDACAAPPEDCNGADDDCDASADEGFACPRGGTTGCTSACGSEGSRTCLADCTLDACVPPGEVCNGLDDDCDGARDDGFSCIRGTDTACTTTCGTTGTRTCDEVCEIGPCAPPPEGCNGMDDDCDLAIDESSECTPGTGMDCTTSCGSSGRRTCGSMCVYGACAPPAEACNGADDDCDAAADEAFACVRGSVGSCATSCGSTGARTCTASCTLGSCLAPPESCNGRDDDCDGRSDNGFACVRGTTVPCTTSCGSAGQRKCSSACTLGACMPPPETCSGVDDDCDGMADEGFACRSGISMPCTTTCSSTGSRSCTAACTWDTCVPPSETCNGVDDDCDAAPDDGFPCIQFQSGTCMTGCGSTGTRQCSMSCGWGACAPPAESCNGADDDCDTNCDNGYACCSGTTTSCATLGLGTGTATCPLDCAAWDTSGCSSCGNGVINGAEECDGGDLGGQTCVTQGFAGGALVCTGSCTFDTSGCSGIDPDGTYSTAPIISYSCVFGFVNFTINTMTFFDSGASLTVNVGPDGPDGGCVAMSGDTATDGMFTVMCVYPGTCTETYSLTGMYTGPDTWMGTYTAQYTGMCFDCTLQSWTINGTRL